MTQQTLTTLLLPLFGITTMVLLLDIKRSDITKKKAKWLFIYCLCVLLVNIYFRSTYGKETYAKFYLLLVQGPCFFGFLIISRYKGFKLLFVLLTAVTFTTLPVLIMVVIKNLAGTNLFYITLGYMFSFFIIFSFIIKYFKPSFMYILEHGDNKLFWKFCIIPIIYYFYNYIKTGYSFSSFLTLRGFVIENMIHAIVFISYILLIDIFESTNEKQRLKNEQEMYISQVEASRQKMRYLEETQKQTLVYRHDMRHHLSLLEGFLQEGKVEEALAYLSDTQVGIESITYHALCKNSAVNLVLLSFESRAKKSGVSLKINADIPEKLSVSDVELCALFSNSLENAFIAARKSQEKQISLRCSIKNGKLLLMIENSYEGEVRITDGLPQTDEPGHGYGIKSLVAIANQWQGHCICNTKDGYFVLRVVLVGVLPVEEEVSNV